MNRREGLANTFKVTVGGTEVADEVMSRLVEGTVESTGRGPDMFELRFTDDAASVIAGGRFGIGEEVALHVRGAGSTAEYLLKAEVTALESELSLDGQQTTIRGQDISHRLHRGTKVETYQDIKASDIAVQVVQAAGLPVEADRTRVAYKHVLRDAMTDWEFLDLLAKKADRSLRVEQGKVLFTKRTDARTAPAEGAQSPLVLVRGHDLLHFRASVTSDGAVPSVSVRGWDPKRKQAVVGVSRPKGLTAQVAQATPSAVSGKVKAHEYLVPASHLSVQAECDEMAAALGEHLASGLAEVEGTVTGNPALAVGKAVRLSKVGDRFNGCYTINWVRHVYAPETGYLTHFTAGTVADRSLHGIVGDQPASGSRMHGVYPAVVTNVQDPDGLGRVRVKFPFLSEQEESWWARVLQLGAGSARGQLALPEVGDEVLVAFGQGDPNTPYVLGGLFNGKDKPADTVGGNGQVERRAWISRKGMFVEFVEKSGEERVTISSADGKQKIDVVQKANAAISVVSSGPVEITADKDITLKATGAINLQATGDLTLKGNNVTIEAQAGLKAKANATAEISSQAAMTVKGAAKAELSSTGVTEVRGSLVKIN